MSNLAIDREENYKHRNIGLHVLARALDDICPKFEHEPPNIRAELIKEREQQFKEQEYLLDKEWEELEKEAEKAVQLLDKEREQVIKRLRKTRNTSKIKAKIKALKRNRDSKIKYLKTRQTNQTTELKRLLKQFDKTNKKFAQTKSKINFVTENTLKSISNVKERYQKIIEKVLATDNAKKIEQRIENSIKIWEAKKQKLKIQYQEREKVFNNKRRELDAIRVAVEGFVFEFSSVEKWCNLVGVRPKVCYIEAKERLSLLGRNSKELNDLVDKLSRTSCKP